MDLQNWIPAISTTGLLSVAVWMARKAIEARLTRSIQHEFDERLESLKADLKSAEERLKAELREKETEIQALRDGTLATLTARRTNVDKRRLEAIDQLWIAFNSLGGARALTASMSIIKFESASKLAEKDPKVRQFFEVIGSGFDQNKIDHLSAAQAQLFVSPMAWAVFSAYRAVVMHSVMRWHTLKAGLGTVEFSDNKAIEKLITAALPHWSEYVSEHGPAVYGNALEQLEAKLISELQAMLAGAESDRAALTQAAEIIREANALQAATALAQSQA